MRNICAAIRLLREYPLEKSTREAVQEVYKQVGHDAFIKHIETCGECRARFAHTEEERERRILLLKDVLLKLSGDRNV